MAALSLSQLHPVPYSNLDAMALNQLEPTNQLDGVAETLMITLYSRYVETQRPDSLFQDPKAVEMAQGTDYNFDKYAKGWASQLGVVVRVQAYDRIVKTFLETHPDAVVISLGCGLCTRFLRVDNGSVRWYEVDFPEVIELRRKFFVESDRYRFIAQSILDFAWIDQIQRTPNQPLLLIMEGVAMYLNEAENRSLMTQIQSRLTPATWMFDVLNQKSAKDSKRHDTVSKTNAEFKWGVNNSKTLEAWGAGIRLEDEVYYLTEFAKHPRRLPLWARYLSPILMPIFKQSGRILCFKLSQPG